VPTHHLIQVMDEGPEDGIAIGTLMDWFKKPRVIAHRPESQQPSNGVDRREGLCRDETVFGQVRLLDQARPQQLFAQGAAE
jgi:hypothetical protein